MLPIYIGAYIFLLSILWGFFFIARHHAYKFQNFSTSIVPVTRFLFGVLIILSLIGLLLIFTFDTNNLEVQIRENTPIIENYY